MFRAVQSLHRREVGGCIFFDVNHKFNHATILHGVKTITNYLQFNDERTIEVYNILKNEISKENEPNAVIQHDNRGEVIT